MSTRWLTAAGLVVALAWSGPLAAQDRPYVWKDGKLEIQFPDTPQEAKGKLELKRDGGKTVYTVTYNEIAALAKAPPEQHVLIFTTTRDNLVKALKGKLLNEKEVKVHGQAGREYQVETPALGVYRTRVFIVGDRLYQAIVMGPADVVNGKEAETFFGSFKVVK